MTPEQNQRPLAQRLLWFAALWLGILSCDLQFPEIESISVMYPPHSPWLLAIERSLGFDGFSNLAKR